MLFLEIAVPVGAHSPGMLEGRVTLSTESKARGLANGGVTVHAGSPSGPQCGLEIETRILFESTTMNIAKMMKQAQQMQEQMAQMQQALGSRSFEATVAGGKVRATANGHGDITALKIAPEVVDPSDVGLLEDLVLAAVKQAAEKAKAVAADEMGKLTGGLGLPPGLGF